MRYSWLATVDAAERILRDPASTELHHGFDTTVAEFTKRLMASAPTAQGLAKTCKAKLLTLGDALGVTGLDNPEAYCAFPEAPPAPETDELLARIEWCLGRRDRSPEPVPE